MNGKITQLLHLNQNIGSFKDQTNLTSLLDALGIPDVSGKSLYTVLITDRLDNAENGNAAILSTINNGNTVWYADSSVSTSGTGTAWSTAFKTIAEAITAASAGDIIKIKGEFNESNLTIDKELTIEGQDESNNHYRTLIYSSDATPLIILKANNVTIKNLGFAQQAANLVIQLGDTAGQAWYKTKIEKCKFDGYGTSTGAVAFGESTVDAPDIHIDNCLFRSFAGDVIISNATRGRYTNNIILTEATFTAINHQPDTSSRPDTIISGNRIIGVNSTDIGIEIANTPDAGTLIAYDNYIFNCATSITQKATNVAVQMNYVNDGAGGALIDPIA